MKTPKTDLSKAHKAYYTANGAPQLHHFDRYPYLRISGQSSPEDERFLSAIPAIYSLAYGIKFLCKAEDQDFVVPKMECQWYVAGGPEKQSLFPETPRHEWCWTILIRLPDFAERRHFETSMQNVLRKKEVPVYAHPVEMEWLNEGLCAQILHLGSYEAEAPTLQVLHQFVHDQGYRLSGYHKEIYLNDPRKTAEEKLRTIIRYPVSPK